MQSYTETILCQTCRPMAYSQADHELCVFKVIKSDVQISPVFTGSVTYVRTLGFSSAIMSHVYVVAT